MYQNFLIAQLLIFLQPFLNPFSFYSSTIFYLVAQSQIIFYYMVMICWRTSKVVIEFTVFTSTSQRPLTELVISYWLLNEELIWVYIVELEREFSNTEKWRNLLGKTCDKTTCLGICYCTMNLANLCQKVGKHPVKVHLLDYFSKLGLRALHWFPIWMH